MSFRPSDFRAKPAYLRQRADGTEEAVTLTDIRGAFAGQSGIHRVMRDLREGRQVVNPKTGSLYKHREP